MNVKDMLDGSCKFVFENGNVRHSIYADKFLVRNCYSDRNYISYEYKNGIYKALNNEFEKCNLYHLLINQYVNYSCFTLPNMRFNLSFDLNNSDVYNVMVSFDKFDVVRQEDIDNFELEQVFRVEDNLIDLRNETLIDCNPNKERDEIWDIGMLHD